MAVTIILSTFGAAAILAAYIDPTLLALPGHTIIHTWQIDFYSLGYPAEELTPRFRLGFVWASMAMIAYMVTVVGGSLILTIYRMGDGNSNSAATDPAAAPAEALEPRRRSIRSRVDMRYWAGRLAGQGISTPGRNGTEMLSN